MKQKLFVLLIFICMASNLSALEGLFTGAGFETGAFTRRGAAIGGGLMAGYEINPHFSAGLRMALLHDLDTITTLNIQGFFRYQLPLPIDGFFAQAEAGIVMFFEAGETFPAFSAGLAAGWRFSFTDNWFMEPVLRFGYPYMWGFGVMAGYRFSARSNY